VLLATCAKYLLADAALNAESDETKIKESARVIADAVDACSLTAVADAIQFDRALTNDAVKGRQHL
jgi:hypothetical protein